MKVVTNLDLCNNEIQNVNIQNLAAAPSSPTPGRIYYNTVDKVYYGWVTSWINLGYNPTAIDIVNIINSGTAIIEDDNLSSNVIDAITKKHSHSNSAILSAMEIAFTNALKNKIDGISNAANKVAVSTTNGNILIDGVESKVYTHPTGTNPHGTTQSDIGILSGTEATKPTATGSGNVYLATDVKKIWKDTAAGAWTQMGGQDSIDWANIINKPLTFTPPIATSSLLGGIKSGTDISIDASGNVSLIPTGTAGTYFKVTTDSKGRITSGVTSLAVSDIPTLTLSKISDAGTAASKNTGIASGNVPILDAGGKLDTSILPALAITDTFVVNTEASMLALTAQTGDVCVRTDLSKSFILKVNDPTVLANWQELLTPTDVVTSVAGKTGPVTLTKSDVGLANVQNTDTTTTLNISDNTDKRFVTDAQKTVLGNTSNTNTGDETLSTIKTKLGITTLSGSNTGDETLATIKSKLGVTTLSGSNTGDETATTIKTKLGYTPAKKFSVNIGDASATTINVVHSLATTDLTVAVIELATNSFILADWQIVDSNTIKFLFAVAPTAAQYRVTVTG